jgi:hypothetical protein
MSLIFLFVKFDIPEYGFSKPFLEILFDSNLFKFCSSKSLIWLLKSTLNTFC